MTRVLVVELDGPAAKHLARALDAHRSWARANGLPLPPALAALALSISATAGQERTNGRDGDGLADAVAVSQIALTFEEVANALSISERSVRRMAAAGELPTIEIAGRRRVHRDDLADYATGLRAENRSAS